jgi:hypothetical protein
MSESILPNETLPVNDESNETIQRCPQDDGYRFSVISNTLIRDVSISPECRWLIIYLLSNKEGWKINVQQVINHLKPHMGRDKVHALFNEAIDAGYLKRETFARKNSKGGALKGFRYIVSEAPKFKKINQYPENQDTGYQGPGFPDSKKDYIDKKDYKKESNTSLKVPKEPAAEAADVSGNKSSKSKREKPDFSPKVREVANQLLNLLLKNCPVYRPPSDLTKFLSHVQDLIEKDKQDPELVIKTFEWAISDNEKRGDFSGWQGIIASNTKGGRSTTPVEIFRKHFAKIHSQMGARPKRKFAASSDQTAAMEAMEEMNKRAL